jgi:hypothetical protein
MFKKITSILIITFLITSCSNTFDSVKRGLTGAKANTADEFLIKKKDPLILPPDFENLPTPDEKASVANEVSVFEKTLDGVEEEYSSGEDGVENSILRKIQSK